MPVTVIDDPTAWAIADGERADLADLAETLAPHDWDRPTACPAWAVRGVVAHVVQCARPSRAADIVEMLVRYRGSPNRLIAGRAVDEGSEPPEVLIERLRATIGSTALPSIVSKPAGVAADILIHHQDVLRAVGRTRRVPPDRLAAVLTHWAGVGGFMKNRQRISGLRLVATDLDWTHGAGPEVRGPGESILLAMSGRPGPLDELDGPGVATLRARF